MPHIHTEPNQHDVTVSAWLFRGEKEQEVFVHMHRKMHKYTEVGGHMELDETPWQTIAHELEEESGYGLDDLEIYQPDYVRPVISHAVTVHPVPTYVVTYQPVKDHYHTDFIYVFHEISGPSSVPGDGESNDLRWMSLKDLEQGVRDGTVLDDVAEIYPVLRDAIRSPGYIRVSTSLFSHGKPPLNDGATERLVK